MADVIKKAVNKFTKGLVMDFSPENTSNELLTHALNATLLTFNGNELSLQNDMGNARVETAFLPEGYMPVGTCEYGGIIYIVSYNPLEDKSLIGCFPSPERNVSNDELGEPDQSIANDNFVDSLGNIKLVTQYKILRKDKLNPGDKFLVSSTDKIYGEFLKDLLIQDGGNYKPVDNPRIALNIVSIDDSGKITYLDSYVRKYEKSASRDGKTSKFKYHILGEKSTTSQLTPTDIDAYRNTVCSGYSVFRSKTSGRLAILAELVTIDSYDVSYSIEQCRDQNGLNILGRYDVIIHTDVTPAVNSDNYLYTPKLKYYYLSNSQGNLMLANKAIVQAFNTAKPQELSSKFLNTKMNEINSTLVSTDTVLELGDFNLPRVDTYHEMIYSYTGTNYSDLTENLYTKFPANSYIRVAAGQIQSKLVELETIYNFKFYHIQKNTLIPINEKHTIDPTLQYYQVHKWYPLRTSSISDHATIPTLLAAGFDVAYKAEWFSQISRSDVSTKNATDYVYLKVGVDTYLTLNTFIPNSTDNNIETLSSFFDVNSESPIFVYKVGEFLPKTSDGIDYKYESLKFASIQIPNVFPQNDLKFPFVYDFTLVPCMDYGKLDHLAVSHRIDFNKFDDFTASKFNTWKYHIDGNQLTLTFGAEVYDTFEENKVDALIVEFYDLWGFVGSIEINDRKSYSGTFTKLISLNTYDVLSTKKIDGNVYTDSYRHNININYDGTNYFCNDKKVLHKANGWEEWDNVSKSWIPLSNSDCGVLYSNILYGVKTYLRTTDSNGIHTFIPSENFFLYTFPIYNEYFYKENNFNNLHYPKLNLALSYQLKDQSSYDVYDHTSLYMGYLDTLDKVKQYLSGNTSDTEFSTVKYYTYNGSTKLFLELGLHENYNNFNIKYDSAINQFFTCDLLLVGLDPGTSYVVNSDSNLTTPELILNYTSVEDLTSTIFSLTDNTFMFGNGKLSITISKDFLDLNFITSTGTKPLDITYQWLVGYRIDVTDIVTQQVPATTVCALLHKNEGTYNYEDFNIKFLEGCLDDKQYMQKYAFYNQCTDWAKIRFGIAEQVTHDILSVHPFKDVWYKDSETYHSNDLGLLNRHLMSDVLSYIGKLTFCMPHIHSLNKNSGTNFVYTKTFYDNDETKDYIAIANDPYRSLTDPEYYGKDKTEEFRGTAPTTVAYDTTFCSMGCITKETYYGNKFISTYGLHDTLKIPIFQAFGYEDAKLYFDQLNPPKILDNVPSTSWVNCLLFQGGSVYTLPKFNSRLVKTMSSIYGYNPDYDRVNVKLGTVNIVDNKVSFMSHLIVLKAKLDFTGSSYTFNDFVGFGDVKASTYIKSLSDFSGIATKDYLGHTIPQLSFKPNVKLCGSDENVLLTSLTYNIPKPKYIDSSLMFDQLVAVKHSDGTHTFISGTPNTKALYGWDDIDRKLVELDVKNYKINKTDGTLTLKKPYRNTVQLKTGLDIDGADGLFLSKMIVGKLQQLDVSVNVTGIPKAYVKREELSGTTIELLLQNIPLGETLTLNSLFNTGGEIYPHGAKLTADIAVEVYDSTINNLNINGKSVYAGNSISVEFTNLTIKIVEKPGKTGPFNVFLKISNIVADITPPDCGSDIVSVIKTPIWGTRPNTATAGYGVSTSYWDLRICYTSLTVNDLEYDGVNQNHRLFMRNLPLYNGDVDDDTGSLYYRAKIYYRPLNNRETWKYQYKDYNVLQLKAGPGFDFVNF